MANAHTAVFTPTQLSRDEAIERVMLTLDDRGADFGGGIRGKHWDASVDGYAYDDQADHDQEGVPSVAEAITRSKGFELTVLDFLFLSAPGEAWVVQGNDSRAVVLSFPSSLYGLAERDETTALRWLDLLSAVSDVLGGARMICGAAVKEKPHTAAELTSFLEAQLRAFKPGAFGLHSAICSPREVEALDRKVVIPAAYTRTPLASAVVLLSLLTRPRP